MKSSKTFDIILFVLLTEFSFGQDVERKEIFGQIFEQSTFALGGVNIINSTTKTAKVSDAEGVFSIAACYYPS